MPLSKQYLMNAFGSESQANMSYLYCAHQADKENFSNTARLFRAIAYSGFVQAGNYYGQLKDLEGGFVTNSTTFFGLGNTGENIKLAIMRKNFETTEMYPIYLRIAKFQGEKGAERSFTWAYLTKRVQKKLLVKVKESVIRGSDPKLGPIQVCKICGYTRIGEVPNKCPVCKATREHFATFVSY